MKSNLFIRLIAYAVLSVWGFISFIMVIGEETTDNPMPLGEFFLLKAAALLSLWLCFKTWMWLIKKGVLPEIEDDEA